MMKISFAPHLKVLAFCYLLANSVLKTQCTLWPWVLYSVIATRRLRVSVWQKSRTSKDIYQVRKRSSIAVLLVATLRALALIYLERQSLFDSHTLHVHCVYGKKSLCSITWWQHFHSGSHFLSVLYKVVHTSAYILLCRFVSPPIVGIAKV